MANDVKRNVLQDPPRARSGSRSWRVTADWHHEMTGGQADSSKEVRAAWAKVLCCLAALGVLAVALPRPGDLVSTVLDAVTGTGQGVGPPAVSGVRSADTAPGVLNTAENAVLLAAGLIVWVLLVWALAIVIIAGFGRLPGAGGRTARNVLRRIAPAAVGRLVIAAVGVTAIAGAAGCAAPDGTGTTLVSVANMAATPTVATTADPTPPLDIDWPDPAPGGSSETPAPTTGDGPAGTAAGGTSTTGPADQSLPQPSADPAAPVSTTPTTGSPNGDPSATASAESTSPGLAPADTPAPDAPAAAGPDSTAPKAIPGAAKPSPVPTTTDPGSPPSSAPRPTAPSIATDPGAVPDPDVRPDQASGTDTPAPAPGTAAEPDGSVTVRPRDTLWAIAADHLPSDAPDAEIDTAWRAWYAANIDVIGADPDLIIPGQHLLPGNPEMRP